MKNKNEKPASNSGSAPLPPEVFDNGEGTHNKDLSQDRKKLIEKINTQMMPEEEKGTPEKDNDTANEQDTSLK